MYCKESTKEYRNSGLNFEFLLINLLDNFDTKPLLIFLTDLKWPMTYNGIQFYGEKWKIL